MHYDLIVNIDLVIFWSLNPKISNMVSNFYFGAISKWNFVGWNLKMNFLLILFLVDIKVQDSYWGAEIVSTTNFLYSEITFVQDWFWKKIYSFDSGTRLY